MSPSDSSKDKFSVQTDSITKQDLGVVKKLEADAPNGNPGLAPKEENTVLQKLQKWADYDSYGEPVPPTRYGTRAAGDLPWPTTAGQAVCCTRRALIYRMGMIQPAPHSADSSL